MRKLLKEEFWFKVNKGPDNECWPWLKHCQKYGRVNWGGAICKAHRIAYELAFGAFDKRLCVLHTCDNPPCCNPKHLFLGTHKDNMRDMVVKKRSNIPIGEKNSRVLLTTPEVLTIRELYASKQKRIVDLANQFKVKDYVIHKIVHRITWRHL